MTTFDIAKEYRALEELIENSYDHETGEVVYDVDEVLKEDIEKLQDKKINKLERLEYLKREFKAKEDALKVEANRLRERAKSFNKKQEYFKKMQDFLLQGEKLKTDKFTFSYRTTKSVDILNVEILPCEFKVVEYKPLKKEIAKALKEGKEVEGAELVEKKSLSIR